MADSPSPEKAGVAVKPPLTLAEWLTAPRPSTTPIVWRHERLWTLAHLRSDVARLVARLQHQQGDRWALCCEDGYRFIIALLATLHAGKIPVLPGHSRPALLNEQRALFDGILSDAPLEWPGTQLVVDTAPTLNDVVQFPPLRDDAVIELFTSGSTGQPKRIVKPIVCLDREAGLLWDQTSPFPMQLLLDDKRMVQAINGQPPQTITAENNPQMFQFNHLLRALFQADRAVLEQNFRVDFKDQGAGRWTLSLTPTTTPLDKIFATIDLAGKDYLQRIVLNDKQGDRTDIVLSQHQLTPAQLTDDERQRFAAQ